MKKKFVSYLFIMLSVFFYFLFCRCVTVYAKPLVVYGGNIVVPNTGTLPVIIDSNVSITAVEEGDLAAGSSITIEDPTGLKFDTLATLELDGNINKTGSTVLSLAGGGYNSDLNKVTLKVVTGNAVGDFVTVNGRTSVASPLKVLPNSSAATINSTGYKLTVKTNVDTTASQTYAVGTIAILAIPKVVSARFTDTAHFTVQFNCNIDSSTARSTALGTSRDLSTIGNGLLIENATTAVTSADMAIDSSDPSKVNVTINTGALKDDETTTVRTVDNNLQFANVLDPQSTPTITSTHRSAEHTPVTIINNTSAINSITVSKTTVGCSTGFYDSATGLASDSSTYCPFKSGRPIDSNSQILDDAFVATVNATAGTPYKVRLAYYSGTTATALTTNSAGWQGDSVSGSNQSVLFNDTGSSGVHTISGTYNDGALQIYFQLGNGLTTSSSSLASGKAGQIVVQASVDNFATTSGMATSPPITVDRIVPTVDQSTTNKPKATSSNTIQAIFSKTMKKTTAENTAGYRVFTTESGAVAEKPVQTATLASDGKTVIVTTTVMPKSSSSTIIFSPTTFSDFRYIPDLVGNRVADTRANFTTPGGTISSITVTQPSTTPPRVANTQSLTVQVNADTGATVKVRLANADIASTTTSYWSSEVTLTEESSGIYKTISTFPTVNASFGSGNIRVVATTDNWSTRTVDDETVTLDNTEPSVTSAIPIGNRKVLVNFNETLYTASGFSPATTYFAISPSTGVGTISTATPQPSKTSVLLGFSGTASTGITYTVTANSSVKDETTVNGVGAANFATFTTPGADTIAPTISSTALAADNSNVTVYVTDNSGKEGVDISSTIASSNTKITQVTKDGVVVSGVISNDVTNVACIFTPGSPFTAGTYMIDLNLTDLAGNASIQSTSFTVYEFLTCSATPEILTYGKSTISVSGGKSPYTATITSDTTGGAAITGSGPTWTVTPGSTAGSITVQVSDSQEPAKTCSVTITSTPCILTVEAQKSAVNGEKISVAAGGGTPPYVFELTTIAPTGAAIDPVSGDYLAPAVSDSTVQTETILATDINSCTGTTTVKIADSAITVTAEVVADKVYFSVSGGTGSSSSGGIIIRPSAEGGNVVLSIHNADMISTTGMEGVTVELLNSCGSVDSSGVYTAPSGQDCVASVKLSKGGEWAKVFIEVKEGIPEVVEGIKVEDVNMDAVVNVNDLTPVIDWILR